MHRTCLSLVVVMLACLRAQCFIARASAHPHALAHAAAVMGPAAAAVRARSALFMAAKRRTNTSKAAAEPPKAKAAEGEHKFAQLGRVLSDFRVSEAKVASIFTALNDYDSMDELITLAAPYAQRSPSELASRLEEKYKVKPAESDILSSALLQLAGQNQQPAVKAKGQAASMPICHTKVVGTTFQPSIPWDTLKAGDVLELKHETNQHDADAVAVYHKDTKLGFIGKELVQAQQLHVDTAQYWAEITNITGGGDKRHGCNIRIYYSSENGKQRTVKPAQPFAAGAAKPSKSAAATFPSGKPSYQRAPSAAGAQQFGRAPSKPAYASGAAPAAKSPKGSDDSFVGFSKVLGVSSYPVPWDQIAVDDRLEFMLDEKKNQVAIVHSKTQQKMGHVNPQLVERYSIVEDIKSKRYNWWAVVSQLTGGGGRQQGCNIHLCSNKPPQGTK